MAVDNRNFVNKFANEGGGDVLVEDKRMEELKSATAKTSSQISTSDNYIPLQDTDGNLVKINPASFEEAVRNVLGGLLANNDKGTTISGIPALSGSGNSLDFGSITPANLASVLLGGIDGSWKEDYDALVTPGIYRLASGSTSAPTATGTFQVRVTKYHNGANYIITQEARNLTNDTYVRSKNGNNAWGDWTRLDNFGCTTPSALASLLGVNIETVTGNDLGKYPSGFGTAIGFTAGNYTGWIFLPKQNEGIGSHVYFTILGNSETITPSVWKYVDITAVSTT